VVISIAFFAILYSFITHGDFSAANYPLPEAKPADYSNIKELGRVLYTEYVIAFEIAAVILLVAIIASIALTFRGRRSRKVQNINKQLQANKKNRLKIVKMDPVVKQSAATEERAEQEAQPW